MEFFMERKVMTAPYNRKSRTEDSFVDEMNSKSRMLVKYAQTH